MMMILETETFQIDCGYDRHYDDFDRYDLWYENDEWVVMISIVMIIIVKV